MKTAVALVLLILLGAAPVAAGEIYKWTDERGGVHFTSSPPPAGRPSEKFTFGSSSEPVVDRIAPAPTPTPEPSAAGEERS